MPNTKQTIVVTEAEMKQLNLHDPHIVPSFFSRQPEADVIARSPDTTYLCLEPFDTYWWASDDPLDTTYVPPEARR